MNYYFSEKEKSQYAEEGFILREDQFSSGELDSFRKIVESTVQSADLVSKKGKVYFLDKKKFVDVDSLTLQYEPKPNDHCLRVIEPAHSLNSQLELIIKDRRLTDPIKSILSVNKISLWTDKLNLKRPEVGSGFSSAC